MASRTNMVVMDARGTIEVHGDRISFQGKKQAWALEQAKATGLERPRFPWIGQLMILGALLLMTFLYVEFLGALVALSADQIVVPMVVGMVAGTIFGTIMWRKQRWVRVDGVMDGRPQTMYLYDGRALGWSGILTGQQDLLGALP